MKHEAIYDIFTFFKSGELRAVGIKQYVRQDRDTKRLAFLQERDA